MRSINSAGLCTYPSDTPVLEIILGYYVNVLWDISSSCVWPHHYAECSQISLQLKSLFKKPNTVHQKLYLPNQRVHTDLDILNMKY